jgi:hypothetical protein
MVIEKTAAGVEAQATTISGIIADNKPPLLLPKSFESCRNGFAPTNADCRVSDMFGTPDRLLTPTKR